MLSPRALKIIEVALLWSAACDLVASEPDNPVWKARELKSRQALLDAADKLSIEIVPAGADKRQRAQATAKMVLDHVVETAVSGRGIIQ